MPTTITDFTIIRPEHELKQEDAVEWLAAIHAREDRSKYEGMRAVLRKIGLGSQKIQTRGVSIKDCFHQDWDNMEIYHSGNEGAGFGKRSRIYDRIASDVLERLYHDNSLPDHLIHVTCTGYVAPSPAQKLVSLRKAQSTVTHAYHMGCYAAIPAIRMGSGFKGSVEVAHTEICSLHLNPLLHEMEQLVVQTLFADGFIKYSLKEGLEKGFQVIKLHEILIPDSLATMEWVCHDWGLKMKLAYEVPQLIAKALPEFVENLLKDLPPANVYFAIHPGGPKIIQKVATILNILPEYYEHSLWVLQNYGNMSSATLPHIWHRLWKDEKVKSGSYIVSLAFGPGLTLAGGVFQCIR